MPTPRADENRDDFVARCIPIVLEDGTAQDQDQAVAVCIQMYDDRDKTGAEDGKMKGQAKEHKTLPFIWTKIDGDQGIVEHTVAVMGNVDLGNDRIHPGAFTKTISERAGKIKVLDAHRSGSVLDVVGKPLSLWEVGRDELSAQVRAAFPDATGALMARTQFLLDTPEGKGAFARIRDGAVDEYSIGYDPITADYTDEQRDGKTVTVRNLKEIRLWEYSPVPFGMNPATSTLSAKESVPDDDPPRYVGAEDEKGASGSTTLPIADRERAWDAQAAVAGIRRATGSEEEPSGRYRNGFFWYDGADADQFTAYKLPFADDVDGTLTAIPRGIFAAAAVMQGARGGADIPEADRGAIRSKIERYYARMREQFDDEGIVVPWKKADEPETEEKAGRVFSAANARRIQAAIDAAQEALADLGAMLQDALPQAEPTDEEAKDAPPPEAATGQDPEAGPPDQAPTDSVTVADIDDWIEELSKLSEES